MTSEGISEVRRAQLRLDELVCFPLYAATRAVTKRYGELLSDAGLTYPQYLVMLVLWEADRPLAVSELGARLRLDSGTLTPLLKRLEGAGLVARRRDAADERRVLVEPTEGGDRLRAKVADVPAQLAAGMGITQEEAAQLRESLAKLLASLDEPIA